MPVLGSHAHAHGSHGEGEDAHAQESGPGHEVSHQAQEDAGDTEDGDEAGTGQELVLHSQAGVVPATGRL